MTKTNWGKSSKKEMNWQDARKWCKKQGGRLPTLGELLIAYKDKTKGFKPNSYWSATENNATCAWYVYFSTGVPYFYHKNNATAVRCVKKSE